MALALETAAMRVVLSWLKSRTRAASSSVWVASKASWRSMRRFCFVIVAVFSLMAAVCAWMAEVLLTMAP